MGRKHELLQVLEDVPREDVLGVSPVVQDVNSHAFMHDLYLVHGFIDYMGIVFALQGSSNIIQGLRLQLDQAIAISINHNEDPIIAPSVGEVVVLAKLIFGKGMEFPLSLVLVAEVVKGQPISAVAIPLLALESGDKLVVIILKFTTSSTAFPSSNWSSMGGKCL